MDIKFKYIQKLHSHIKSDRKKEEILYEITDHWLEREKWYTDIGYDHDAAEAMTAEDMGDADVAGEQFAAIQKRRFPFWLPLLLLPVMILFLLAPGANEGWRCWQNYYQSTALLAASLVLFIIFSRRQRIAETTICAFSAAYVLIRFPYIANTWIFMTQKFNSVYCFFQSLTYEYYDCGVTENDEEITIYDYNPITQNARYPESWQHTARAVGWGLILAVLICLAAIIMIQIKTRMLKNKKADHGISFGLRMVLSVLTIGILCTAGWQVRQYYEITPQTLRQNISDSLIKANADALKKIETYEKTGVMQKDVFTYDHLGYIKTTENNLNIETDAKLFYFKDEKILPVTEKTGKEALEFAKRGGTLDQAPTPYTISYDKEDRQLKITYYYAEHAIVWLYFKYKDGQFVMTDYSSDFEINADLTSAQRERSTLRLKSI